jgi:Flp pilus assembly protein protease CpaA
MPVLSRMWTMFTEITNWVVLFSACSGVYLWLSRREDRLAGWSILIGAGVLSIGFMAYLWLWG